MEIIYSSRCLRFTLTAYLYYVVICIATIPTSLGSLQFSIPIAIGTIQYNAKLITKCQLSSSRIRYFIPANDKQENYRFQPNFNI
jgi:hypothetical protein